MRHQVIIALGSNVHPCAHIQWASQRLVTLLGSDAAVTECANAPSHRSLRFSRTLWTPDVKGTGHYYMNRLLATTTTLSADDLTAALKDIEADSGRQHERVTIDLDLMQYDNHRLHLNDWPRPYIQLLLPDIM